MEWNRINLDIFVRKTENDGNGDTLLIDGSLLLPSYIMVLSVLSKYYKCLDEAML